MNFHKLKQQMKINKLFKTSNVVLFWFLNKVIVQVFLFTQFLKHFIH